MFILLFLLALSCAYVPTTLSKSPETRIIAGHYRNDDGIMLLLECAGTTGPAQLFGWLDFNSSDKGRAFPMAGYTTTCIVPAQLAMAVPGHNNQSENEHWALGLTGQVEDTYPITIRLTLVRTSATTPENSWLSNTISFYEFYKVGSSSSTTTVS